jgi:hypothetical protein
MPTINHYPSGTDLLWLAHFSNDGGMDGPTRKISGTIEEAVAEAQEYAEQNDIRLQCIHRRYNS